MFQIFDNNKRFFSYSSFLKQKFSEKVYKVPIALAKTCPNRDGTKGTGGCIFCSEIGSSEFSSHYSVNIKEQFSYMISTYNKWNANKFIIYFQSYTNTYMPLDILENAILESLGIENVVGISIATRPDCINDDVIELLKKYSEKTYISIELGLQTSNDDTHRLINSCFTTDDYIVSMKKLKSANIDVVTHIIIGLPLETKKDIIETVKVSIMSGTSGVKLQLLYVLKNTKLEKMYNDNLFQEMPFSDYINIVADIIEILPENVVIHRLTGDGKKEDLVAPLYSLNKRNILNSIDKKLIERNTYQGIKNI